MKAQTWCRSGLTSVALAATLFTFGLGYTGTSQAAQGCGFGYHMSYYGRCLPNAPGPYARFLPGRPNCWINRWGATRCY